jgi:hypothetical protein
MKPTNSTTDTQPENRISIFIVVLVVLLLVSILAGLMLPALAKAKARAQRGPRLLDTIALDDVSAARPPFHTEAYDHRVDNPFLAVTENPLSTFSIDVDTASYANVRRFLSQGQLPPPDAVRIEEIVNYFTYAYPESVDVHSFSVTLEAHGCPWNLEHRLVRVGLKAKTVQPKERPACNLVFLSTSPARWKTPTSCRSSNARWNCWWANSPIRIGSPLWFTPAHPALSWTGLPAGIGEQSCAPSGA